MPTFIELMSRDEVILRAIKRLPKNGRADLQGCPEGAWVSIIKGHLSVSSAFSTTMLDVSYQSKDPKAAAVVLGCMLSAYEDYLDATHNGFSEDSIRKLQQQLEEDRSKLDQEITRRLTLRQSVPELVQTGDKNVGLSIVSETIKLLNTDLAVAQRTTGQSQTQFDGLQRAIANGEDILQFANKTLDTAGRQWIEQSMGLGSGDAFYIQRINQQLLDMEGDLRDARMRYGEKHSRIQALKDGIQLKNNHLQSYRGEQQKEMQRLAHTELAPRLVQYLRQQLETNRQNEQTIYQQLETEKGKAQTLARIVAELDKADREIERLSTKIEEYQNQADGIGINKDKMIITDVARKPTVSVRPVSPRLAITGLLSLMMGTAPILNKAKAAEIRGRPCRTMTRTRSPERTPLWLRWAAQALTSSSSSEKDKER